MSLKPNNTDKAAKKVVRSQLSQAYTNAKEGIYVTENTVIEPTRLEEPSSLLKQSKIDAESAANIQTDVSSAGVQLGSVKLTTETIDDLMSMLDVRELEKWTDGWLSSALAYTLPTAEVQRGFEVIDHVKEEIKDAKEYARRRGIFVSAIQKYIIDSQRRKILESREYSYIGSNKMIEKDVPTYSSYLPSFSPHGRALMQHQAKLIWRDLGILSDDNFYSIELPFIDHSFILTNQEEMNLIFSNRGKNHVALSDRYHATSIILSLIDWTALTIDHGFTPNYFCYSSNAAESKPVYDLSSRLQVPDEVIPRLRDIGLYAYTRENLVTGNVLSPGTQLGPNGFPIPPSPNQYDDSRPNLLLGSDRNPAVRVMRSFEKMSNFSNNNKYFGTSLGGTDILTIAHMCAMLRSESLQSIGIEDVESEQLPSVDDRLTRLFGIGTAVQLDGIGRTILGSPSSNPIKKGYKGAGYPLIHIVADGTEDDPVLPFEKGLKQNRPDEGVKDIFDTHLESVLDPNTPEVDRRAAIDEITDIYSRRVERAIDATKAVANLYGESKKRNKAGEAWIQNNMVPYKPGPSEVKDHPGGGPAQVLGHMISNPCIQIAKIFRKNEEETCTAFPFDYWASSNHQGIQNDRDTIAQITGLIGTVKQGILNRDQRELLRSSIVEALVNRDLGVLLDYPGSFGKARAVGYHESIAAVQSEKVKAVMPSILGISGQIGNTWVNPGDDQIKTVSNFIYNASIQQLPETYFITNNWQEGQQVSSQNLYDFTFGQAPLSNQSVVLDPIDLSPGIFEFESGVNPLQATDEYMQGNRSKAYRVTKFNRIRHFMTAVLGEKKSNRSDLYDAILADVDELDRSLATNPASTFGSYSHHVDGRFGESGNIGIKPGNFTEKSGVTNAHAFDRATLISFVVDMYARILNDTFFVKMGTSNEGRNKINQLNEGAMREMPLVVEVSLRSSLDLERQRSLEYIDSISPSAPVVERYINLHKFSQVSFDRTCRIFKAIKLVTNELEWTLYKHRDTQSLSKLGPLIARTACIADVENIWTEVPTPENKQFRLATNVTGVGGQIYTHSETITGATLTKPFGNLSTPVNNGPGAQQGFHDFFVTTFHSKTSHYKIGNDSVAQFLLKVSEAIEFCSNQEGAAVKGMLSMTKFINRYYETAGILQKAKDTYAEFEGKTESQVIPPRDVSKAQIDSKLRYLNMMEQRHDDTSDSVNMRYIGGYTYEEIRYLNILSKAFLRDLKNRYEDEGVSSKTFYFYGMPPNQKYKSIIAKSEELGVSDYFVYERVGDKQRKHGSVVNVDYTAVSGLESQIKYKFGGDRKYHDIDHRVTDPLVIRHMKDMLSLGGVGEQNMSYDDFVESLPILRLTDIGGTGLGDPSLHKWLQDFNDAIAPFAKNYSELISKSSLSEEQAFDLIKRKVDGFCLKYIMNIVADVCFDENYIGLNTREIEVYRFAATQDIKNEYFEPIEVDGVVTTKIKTRPYDERFKRALRPTLSREENEPLAKLKPPVLDNSELVAAEIISNSNLLRSYLNLKETKFDEVYVEDFSPRSHLVVDTDESDSSLLEGEGDRKQLKAEYQALDTSGGLFVVNPKLNVNFIISSED